MTRSAPYFRLLDHTGDIALLVRAGSLEELFDVASRALFEVILDTRTVEPAERVGIEVRDAVDHEDLLVRFLSELLFLHDARGWVFRGAESIEFEPGGVRARAVGEPIDPRRHAVQRQVKAVTYHHLLVSQDAEGWSARIVLDL